MSKHPLRCVTLRCVAMIPVPRALKLLPLGNGFLDFCKCGAGWRPGELSVTNSGPFHRRGTPTVQAIPVTIYSKGYRTIEKARVQCR